ncbi:MAG: hypothetical protein LBM60_07500, partial [Clostridium sp.]|nr:hypothetical protein [Clostridium sp.]
MEDFVKLVLHIYLWFCVIDLIAYLPRIAFYLFAFKKQDRLVNHIKNKIAVIVPARNESAVIK